MKKNFVVLSITALLALVSLAGCAATPSCPECPECPTCEEKPNDGTGSGETPIEPPVIVEPVDPSEGLINPEDSEWGETLTGLMVNYLGGGILPLIDLGEGELDGEFIKSDEDEDFKSYLKIVGGNFLVSRLQSAVNDYKEHYWDALMVGDSFYASNDLLKVEVEVTRNYNDLFELKAFYNEPFNPEDVSSWNEATETFIKERFGRFEIPFVYLGTKNYDSTITETGSLLVSGGTWNDSVINQFETSFKNWEITRDEETLTTRYATFKDGENTLSATLLKEHNKAQLEVSITEVFDSTNQTSWSSEVLKAMDRSLNKTILPYVYLGAIYPTIDASGTNERSLTLTGKHWDDSILASAKEAFKKDTTWTASDTETRVMFTKKNDFDSYEVVVEKSEAGIPTLRATRKEVYNETSLTDYTEELKTAFKEKYAEEITNVPFLYLGTAYPTLNTEIPAKHDEDVNKLVITGGKYDSRILDNFKNKFTIGNGWYCEINNVREDNGSEYDDTGKTLAVAIKNTGTFTYKVGLFTLLEAGETTAYLEINRSENVGTTNSSWSEETLATLKTVLGGDVKIPHFDTGRDTLEIEFDDYGQLAIQFLADHTNFSYRVWSVIDTLTKDNWEVKLAHNDTYYDNETWINQIVATKEFNGKKVAININVNPSYYYRFAIFGSISLVETYDPSKEVGSWSESVSTEIKNRYKVDLPYIYLGTDTPYLFEDTRNECLKIIGNALTEGLYVNARKVLTDNGFLIDASESSEMSIVATKENSDGNIVTIEVDHEDGKPYIALYLTEIFKPGTETSWDAETQKVLDAELPTGITVPYLYLGTNEPTISSETTSNGKKISIVGGNWDDAVINLTKTTLQDSSFTVSTTKDSVVAYDLLLDSEETKVVRMQLSENYDYKIQLDVYLDTKPKELNTEIAKWEDFPADYDGNKPDKSMETYLGKVLPEFVPAAIAPSKDDGININTPYTQYSNSYISFSSYYSIYNSYYLYVMMENLEKEGFTITYNPFFIREMAGFSASKKDADGEFIITFAPSNGYFEDLDNGFNLSVIYLPNENQFADVTEFAESDRNKISSSLDGLLLPYANLGSKVQKISAENGTVTITGYNYSESIIENIKKAYSGEGWTINDTYAISNGHAYKTINGYLKTESGHTYVLTVTPKLSKAVHGNGSLSSSSVLTEITVSMA